MKIGILLCGDVPEPLTEEFGSYSSCLQNQLNLKGDVILTVFNIYQKNELPDNADSFDGFIIGGSQTGVNDDVDWIKPLAKFIHNAFYRGKKLFGICFGHQMIHHALGGIVMRSPAGWGLGAYEVTLFKDFEQLKTGEKISILAIHQDQVIKPAEYFDIIAGNDFCPNYLTRYKKQVLTIQGHPEFNFSFFLALINASENRFLPAILEHAVEERTSEKDRLYFNQCVNNFILEQ
ncbi:type 1 glutamine amidotransferase [Shewanella frigidimarina]|uniref:Glutamine amidotransferase domain-containing protein n=1 Tax=Shewanella frigidimarina TaxID=56812 RepID=A0A119D040_SHEFR|nr:type 1 glutamine amidotransferase [Shewanella frigidimarina]KVX02348.1 hypothetical protein AWJ07_14470 [Shewanella frigidimarina]